MSLMLDNAESQMEHLPTVRRGLTADQARKINSLRVHPPTKSVASQQLDDFIPADLDSVDLDPDARALLDEYQMHGNKQDELPTRYSNFPERAEEDNVTRPRPMRAPLTSTKKKQNLDPATVKPINQFARRHIFFSEQSFKKYTTSQRRTFERAVYDYARSIGLSKSQAEASRIYTRRLCGEEDYNSDDSRLDEDEIDDSAVLLNQSSTAFEAPASICTTATTNNKEQAGDAPENPSAMKLQPNANPPSSETLRAEVQCPRKDGAAAATMTPAIPALRNQSSAGGPDDATSEALSSKADNGLSQTVTDHLPTAAKNSNATSTFRPLEPSGNTENIVGDTLDAMANADSATSTRSERLSTSSCSLPAVSGNHGGTAAGKVSTGPLTVGAAEESNANVQDRGDHQRLDGTANPQTQTLLELGSQGSKHDYQDPVASGEDSMTTLNEAHKVKETQEVATQTQPKSGSTLQVIERTFEKYSKIGNAWQPATTADRTQTEPEADVKMHDRSESSDTNSTLSSEDSQGSTDDESSEEEQPGPNLQLRTSRVAQPVEEGAEEDNESGDSGDSEADSENVNAAQSEDDNDASEDSTDSEDDDYPEQEEKEEEKRNVLVQKWLTGASTAAPKAVSQWCNICRKGPFVVKGQLRKHRRKHPMTVPCGKCNRLFRLERDLSTHIEAKHGNAVQTCHKRKRNEEIHGGMQKKLKKSEARSSTGQFTPSESSQEGGHKAITRSRSRFLQLQGV